MTVAGAAAGRRYAFLGPAGTFTEAALRQVLPTGAVALPLPSVEAALAAVRSGAAEGAVVPLENSVEGGVSATLDALSEGSAVRITREVLVPITFVLAARPGTVLADVRRVASHPHGWAQCRGWVREHLPDAAYLAAPSTAAAAQDLAPGPGDGRTAALCAPLAAERFGLQVLARDVGDNAAAVTRFVLVQRLGAPAPPTGADRTSLVVYQRDDHPGGLLALLEEFATRGVNLTRIESRPTGERLGRYCFAIDCEGHISQPQVGEALQGLHRGSRQVRFLGSYPRADVAPGTGAGPGVDAAYDLASRWVESLRSGDG